jgi:hypothetical protein
MAEQNKDKKDKKPKGGAGAPPTGKARKPKADAGQAVDIDTGDEPAQPAPPARLSIKYRDEIVPALQQKLGMTNKFAVPRLEKIVISMGVGRFATEGGEGKGRSRRPRRSCRSSPARSRCGAGPRRAWPTSRSARARRPA